MFLDKKGLWLLLIVCTRTVLTTTWCHNLSLENKRDDERTSDYLLEANLWSKSMAECSTFCYFNPKCVSFFFRKSNEVCRLHRGKLSDLTSAYEDGWVGYNFRDYTCNQEAQLCYKLHTEEKTWDAARTVCHSENAELITLNTDAKKTVIQDIALQYKVNYFKRNHRRILPETNPSVSGSGDFFIGSKYDSSAKQWKWINDNSTVTWFTDSGGKNDCIEIETSGGTIQYDATGCNQEELFFCERKL